MAIGSQLQRLLKAHNTNIPKVSHKTGIPVSTLYSLRDRDSHSANQDMIESLANHFDVPVSFFFLEEGTSPSMHMDLVYDRPRTRSLRSQAHMSVEGPGLQDVTTAVFSQFYQRCRAAQLTDESMAPKYGLGSVVVANTEQKAALGDEGLFNYNGKTVFRVLGNGFLLAHNPLFVPLGLDTEWECIGRVKGAISL